MGASPLELAQMGTCHQPIFGAHLLGVPELAALCQVPMSHPWLVPAQGIFTSIASGSRVAHLPPQLPSPPLPPHLN